MTCLPQCRAVHRVELEQQQFGNATSGSGNQANARATALRSGTASGCSAAATLGRNLPGWYSRLARLSPAACQTPHAVVEHDLHALLRAKGARNGGVGLPGGAARWLRRARGARPVKTCASNSVDTEWKPLR
ncbi:hypothetical protein LJR230_000209 [Trinickia sp. LjRoot230]|uniref:hypothetical protein n=1 Tax=Trinickia sp. LjRoot230 TaxID=3342288 RepID=UPI003ED0436A